MNGYLFIFFLVGVLFVLICAMDVLVFRKQAPEVLKEGIKAQFEDRA